MVVLYFQNKTDRAHVPPECLKRLNDILQDESVGHNSRRYLIVIYLYLKERNLLKNRFKTRHFRDAIGPTSTPFYHDCPISSNEARCGLAWGCKHGLVEYDSRSRNYLYWFTEKFIKKGLKAIPKK